MAHTFDTDRERQQRTPRIPAWAPALHKTPTSYRSVLLHLQRTAGNHAVNALLQRFDATSMNQSLGLRSGRTSVIQRGHDTEDGSTSDPASRAAYQRYLETLREAMAKPTATDPALAKIFDELYRTTATVGSGSTAAAVREELATGKPTKGSYHMQKALDKMNELASWIKSHPKASPSDMTAAENVFKDLQEAVHSGYYADISYSPTPSGASTGGPGGGEVPTAGSVFENTPNPSPSGPSVEAGNPLTEGTGVDVTPTPTPSEPLASGPKLSGVGRVAGVASTAITVLGSLSLLNTLNDGFQGRVQVDLEGLDPGDFEVGHEWHDIPIGRDEQMGEVYVDIRVERNIYFRKTFYVVRAYSFA